MALFTLDSPRPRFLFPAQLSEVPVRLVAGGVSLALLWAALVSVRWMVPLLAIGFALRVYAGPRLSPLARLAVIVTTLAGARGRTVPGAPKQFAAAMGATALVASTALLYVGLTLAGWSLAMGVAALAGLEALFGYCVGCKLYAALFGCAECAGADASSGGGGGCALPETSRP